MEMRAQIVANILPIFVDLVPNLLHHNNVGVNYVRIFNFKMELVRSIPLYFVAMPHSIIIVIEILFTTTTTHTILGMRSKPQIPKGTNLVSMHTKMPVKVDMIFVTNQSNLRRRGSWPLDL